MFSGLLFPWLIKLIFSCSLLSLCSRHTVSNMFGASNRGIELKYINRIARILRIAIHIVSAPKYCDNIVSWRPWQFPALVFVQYTHTQHSTVVSASNSSQQTAYTTGLYLPNAWVPSRGGVAMHSFPGEARVFVHHCAGYFKEPKVPVEFRDATAFRWQGMNRMDRNIYVACPGWMWMSNVSIGTVQLQTKHGTACENNRSTKAEPSYTYCI
jgi:hypothetical protein